MKTTLEFTDTQLEILSAALRQYERFHRVTSPSPCLSLAEEAEAIAQRVERCIESYDGPSYSRGDREDFHSDG